MHLWKPKHDFQLILKQEILVDRAVHAAVSRHMPSYSVYDASEKPALVREDFAQAIHDFLPVAMRGITKSASEGGRSGWEDVGGLVDIQNAIQEVSRFFSYYNLHNTTLN